MEPGSDEAYRDQLKGDLVYLFNNSYHGKTAKRSIEGPQICTRARELSPRVVQGKDFVAVTTSFRYQIAAPGKKTGSEWSQALVFPAGQRYFISSDKITSVNASDAMFLRIDMPGRELKPKVWGGINLDIDLERTDIQGPVYIGSSTRVEGSSEMPARSGLPPRSFVVSACRSSAVITSNPRRTRSTPGTSRRTF